MSKRGKIPIAEGERIAKKYDAAMVIVFSLLDRGNTFNVMTYGRTRALCRYAADIGSKIADAILDGKIVPAQIEPKHLPEVPMEWEQQPAGIKITPDSMPLG
jgi:hypothetical protein